MNPVNFINPSIADFMLKATMIGSAIMFGGAAVLAMGWAFRDGQFDNFQQGSQSIFGPDEPIGEATDELLKPVEVHGEG